MRVVIVGAGAMGSLFGFFFHQAGKKVWLLDKHPELTQKIRKKGLRIEGISGEHQIFLPITTKVSEIGTADLIIIFVKSYDTAQAILDAQPLIGPNSVVLTLQNGIGNLETITKVVGKERTLAGTTAHGATVIEPGHIHHAGKGETIIGEIDGSESLRLKKIKNFFESAGIETQITYDVKGLLWSKLLINIGINPLTAITGLRNGQLLDYEETRKIIARLLNEAQLLIDKKGIKLNYSDPFSKVEAVCQATSLNISSMLQDIRNKKKTEIDFINGAILTEGKKYGLDFPINQSLTYLIHLLELSSF